MPTFRYLAKRGPTEVIEGVLEAENRANVLMHLAQQGYTPVRITEGSTDDGVSLAPVGLGTRGVKVPTRQLNQFTRQFASLVRSQVPLLRALGILKDQTNHPRLKRIVEAIGEEIRQGQTLSGALEKYPWVFSQLYVSLTRSGEVAGMLDTVLDRLALQADREEALRSKVQGAMTYPFFVGAVGLATVTFLLAFVMPRLVKLFKGFGGQLPLPTRILLMVSGWMSQPWFWGACGIMALFLVVLLRGRGEESRLFLDRIALATPLVKTLVRQLELARFARAYGLLLDHGIPILQATEIAIPVVENRIIRKGLTPLTHHLREGGSLSSCLKGLSVATPFLVNSVAVGEEGGKAGEALIEVANFYEQEVERLLQILAGLLEPTMILVVGGIVGFIVMAVLLPIFEVSSLVHVR